MRLSIVLKLALAALSVCPVVLNGAEGDKPESEQVGTGLAEIRERAEAWYRRALLLEQAGEYPEAEDWLDKVLLAMPEHAEARIALLRVQELSAKRQASSGGGAQRKDTLSELAELEVKIALTRAERQVADGDLEAARESAQQAAALLEQYDFPTYQDRLDEVHATVDDLQVATDSGNKEDEAALRLKAQERAFLNADRLAGEAEHEFHQRLVRILEQKQKRHYELALSLSRRLVSDYPEEPQCEALFNELLELVHEQRRRDLKEQMVWTKKEVFERIHRSMIPTGIDGSPEFPVTWFEVQDKRRSVWLQGMDQGREEWKTAIENKLAQRMDINIAEMQIGDALDLLADLAVLNIVVDPEVRGVDGVPVTLNVSDMSVGNILSFLTRQAGVRWSMRNEAIWVGGDESDPATIRIYDVAQLAHAPVDQAGLDGIAFFALDGGDGGFGGGLFGDAGGGDGEGGIAPEDLVDLIQNAVAPESWDNPDYSITIRGNRLFVNTSEDVHALVQEFLAGQVRANSQLVHIRMKWLTISDNFMEEIGVDWHNLGGQVLDTPFTQGYTNRQQEWSLLGSLVNNLPDVAVNVGQAAATSGLQLHWLHLDDLALPAITAFFTAQERKQKIRTLESVELATLNGVRSNTFFGRQVAYISDYDIGGGGNPDPVIDVLNVGQALDIKPFISADKKYVTLDVRPTVSSVQLFTENITFVTNQNNVLVLSGFPLELPNVLLKSAGTRVSIPDQGTVLVGGFGDHIDQHASTKIPIIGHIPFLGRLFGKRGRYSERTQLYLTVTARIILYEEEETHL